MKKQILLILVLAYCSSPPQKNVFQKKEGPRFKNVKQQDIEGEVSEQITQDNYNGLTWKTCSEGLTGIDCYNGSPVKADWKTASEKVCSNLNQLNQGKGYSGINTWRLPTIQEIISIVDSEKSKYPLINSSNFPGTIPGKYWTATAYAGNQDDAWMIHLADGLPYNSNKTGTANVRCVSGKTLSQPHNFSDVKDGIIKDNLTGLYWQKCNALQKNQNLCTGPQGFPNFEEAENYCKTLNLGKRVWRLPTYFELQSIVDYNKFNPASDSKTFLHISPGNYWTTNTYSLIKSNAWVVNFFDGSLLYASKDSNLSARCVSGP